jgi:hypothetical protein
MEHLSDNMNDLQLNVQGSPLVEQTKRSIDFLISNAFPIFFEDDLEYCKYLIDQQCRELVLTHLIGEEMKICIPANTTEFDHIGEECLEYKGQDS